MYLGAAAWEDLLVVSAKVSAKLTTKNNSQSVTETTVENAKLSNRTQIIVKWMGVKEIKERWTTKGYKEMVGGDGYIWFLDHDNAFTNV